MKLHQIIADVYLASMAIVFVDFIFGVANEARKGNQIHSKAIEYLVRALIVAPFSALFVLAIWLLDICDALQQLLGRLLRQK